MKATEFLRHLTKQMEEHLTKSTGSVSDLALTTALGIKINTLYKWRLEDTELSALQVARVVASAHKAAQNHVHSEAIKPLVEFFRIEPTEVGNSENRLHVFPTGPGSGQHLTGLCAILTAAKSGLYIFYDSRGKALYAGHTKKQNIWKEMNSAFNRDRSSQVVTLVRHPHRDVGFKTASIKVRQPTDRVLRLHDLAAYFSAYEVIPEMVDDLEALLIRAFPNDMLNYKMEKFHKSARRAARTKALNAAAKAK
jgi:hypothetical protein